MNVAARRKTGNTCQSKRIPLKTKNMAYIRLYKQKEKKKYDIKKMAI